MLSLLPGQSVASILLKTPVPQVPHGGIHGSFGYHGPNVTRLVDPFGATISLRRIVCEDHRQIWPADTIATLRSPIQVLNQSVPAAVFLVLSVRQAISGVSQASFHPTGLQASHQ
jgi:hypothetical protein